MLVIDSGAAGGKEAVSVWEHPLTVFYCGPILNSHAGAKIPCYIASRFHGGEIFPTLVTEY